MKKSILIINLLDEELTFHHLSPLVEVKCYKKLEHLMLVETEKHYKLIIIVVDEQLPHVHEDIQSLSSSLIVLSGKHHFLSFMITSIIDSVETYAEPSVKSSFFNQSLNFIEEHLYDDELSLDKVSSRFYVSRCHYSRMFQKNVGRGFKEYIIGKRIAKAKELLQNGESVTDTCYAVGYNDLSHFARIFKKIVGENPSMYRKKIATKPPSLYRKKMVNENAKEGFNDESVIF
ncbi:helix-turn-helix transcriptional regulator [Longirhabdus pacifica]|uniref:helix-turn-helix transcriptional regulator n=1 Tax=Longirhabdus pacifica TaxID=2305227 RepID=UPI0013E8C880|nr:AraC family transcriptional regulator [Longirhabdus pacifica]